MAELYDRIGVGYERTRAEDPRIAARIHAALGDAASVVNVGAGSGHYEPRDREVLAVEPSAVMLAHRPPDAAPAVQAAAEALPLADGAMDAAMAVLSDHHWSDRPRGLRELVRVARRRVVLFTWDPDFVTRSWIARDYLPDLGTLPGMRLADIVACLGGARVEAVPIPHDCRDGFLHAFWRRPEAYLDPRVRAGISVFARLPGAVEAPMLGALRRHLDSGAWAERNAELLELDELDLGYRLLVSERMTDTSSPSSSPLVRMASAGPAKAGASTPREKPE